METPSVSTSTPPQASQPPATGAPSPRQPLTREQRDAIFAKAAATMQPARTPALIELLEWKPQIMEYYAKGFSAAQIRDMLQAGNVATSERVVQRFVAKYSHRKRPAAPRRTATAGVNAAPTAANEPPAALQSTAKPAPSARPSAAKSSADSATEKRT